MKQVEIIKEKLAVVESNLVKFSNVSLLLHEVSVALDVMKNDIELYLQHASAMKKYIESSTVYSVEEKQIRINFYDAIVKRYTSPFNSLTLKYEELMMKYCK